MSAGALPAYVQKHQMNRDSCARTTIQHFSLSYSGTYIHPRSLFCTVHFPLLLIACSKITAHLYDLIDSGLVFFPLWPL